MTVSVIIPTFNRSQRIFKALHSVFLQTYPHKEVIVIDDGSTDDTKTLVKTFPQVNYYWQKNRGVSAARNLGIKKARGEWIALLDSDDCWKEDKLAKQMSAFEKAPHYKICHTNEEWVRNGEVLQKKKKHRKYGGWIFQKCLPLCIISPSSVMIHRSLFTKVGRFDETLPACEDYDMWLRITSLYPILYLDEKLTIKHGGHEDQLSQKHWGMDRFRIRALKKVLASRPLPKEDREAALRMLQVKTKIFLTGAKKRKESS